MNDSAPSHSDAVVVRVADRGGKYVYEDMGYITCFVVLSSICALMCWIQLVPLGLMVTAGCGAFAAWIAKQIKIGRSQRRRVLADPEPQLVVDENGISGSVVMLEGKRRSAMDQTGEARFYLPWDSVNYVEFNSAHGNDGLPYMVIGPRDEFDRSRHFFVSRQALRGKEKAIADKARQRGVHVSVEDVLH